MRWALRSHGRGTVAPPSTGSPASADSGSPSTLSSTDVALRVVHSTGTAAPALVHSALAGAVRVSTDGRGRGLGARRTVITTTDSDASPPSPSAVRVTTCRPSSHGSGMSPAPEVG